MIYAGTNGDGPQQSSTVPSGRVWVTTNADSQPPTWTDVTGAINPEQYPVASIALDSSDTSGRTAYVAIMGFHVSHVWKTTDAGLTWTDFSGTGNASLPDSPVNNLVADSLGKIIYVGTDAGVFSSATTAPAWSEVGPNSPPGLLPNVAVTALQIFDSNGVKKLRASTYGRGIWEINLIPEANFSVNATPSQTVFPGQSATFTGTASAFNGYSGSVALICAAAGTSQPQVCNVSPASVTPTTSGTNFTVTASDGIGDYSFKIRGSGSDGNGNIISHDAPLTLHVADYSLGQLTPASVNVPRGTTSSSLDFLVTAIASFQGTVNLSCSGLPTGASCAFTPSAAVNPVTGTPVDAGVTVTVPASSPLASSTITISATSAGAPAARMQVFTMNVVANPDFQLSPGPDFPSVKPGGTTTGAINVSSQEGFAGVVHLACQIDGGQGSCSVSPNVLNSYPASPNISVNATGLAGGDATFTVTGTSNTSTHTLTVPFEVSDFQLAASAASALVGQTATSTLTITPLHSYTGEVGLDCDVTAIPGASCTFNPPSPVKVEDTAIQVTVMVNIPKSTQDGNYAVSVNAQDADGAPQHATTISIAVEGDFGIAALIPSITIQSGQPAQFTFNISPTNGSFNNNVSFSCSGVPALSSCSFSPSSMVPGSITKSIEMNVSTTPPTASLQSASSARPFLRVRLMPDYALLFPMAGLILGINPLLISRKRRRKAGMLSILLLFLLSLPSCGGGGLVGNNSATAKPGTSAGTYTITATAASGTLSHSVQVSLIVQ